MEWVASTLTLPRNMVYPALLPLIRTPRLPAVDSTNAPADLNGLVRFAERPNLVSARVPSRFKRSLLLRKACGFINSETKQMFTLYHWSRTVETILVKFYVRSPW